MAKHSYNLVLFVKDFVMGVLVTLSFAYIMVDDFSFSYHVLLSLNILKDRKRHCRLFSDVSVVFCCVFFSQFFVKVLYLLKLCNGNVFLLKKDKSFLLSLNTISCIVTLLALGLHWFLLTKHQYYKLYNYVSDYEEARLLNIYNNTDDFFISSAETSPKYKSIRRVLNEGNDATMLTSKV